jgi:hypothetical protein
VKKKIKVQNDDGIIAIRGDFQESVLYLKNQPIQYTWFGSIGSTWRFHIAKGLPKTSIKENIANQELVKKGISSKEEFYEIVDYYRQFLGRGEYEFGYYKLHIHHDWINIPKNDMYKCFDYYGGCPDIIPTQNNINEEIVEFYITQIKLGLKPNIIVLHNEDSYIIFILDGHHKFLAYKKLKLEPYAVIITKLGKSTMTESEALELANRMNCDNEKYLKSIMDEKQDKYFNLRLNLDKDYKEIEK